MTRPFRIIACIALFAFSFAAVASAAASKTKSKSASVAAGKTRTITVAYPDALKFGDAKYKCSAKVTEGDESMVTIKKGSAQGGSVCQAKATNKGSDSVTVKVTATTTRQSQSSSSGSQGQGGY
jgi:ABC-type amino acid transport substrate-binding protein